MFAFRHFAIAVSITASSATSPLAITPASAATGVPLNVSGYEYSLGSNCWLGVTQATCGVQFGGWTGGSGPYANGWRGFPGDGHGLWKASVNYTGKAAFGATAKLAGGAFDVMLTNGLNVHGLVGGGSVVWPANQWTDAGCGPGVAVVRASVLYTRGVSGWGSFKGCLRDLPVGVSIPPKIWGTLVL